MQTYKVELVGEEPGNSPFWMIVAESEQKAIAWLAADQERPIIEFVIHPPVMRKVK